MKFIDVDKIIWRQSPFLTVSSLSGLLGELKFDLFVTSTDLDEMPPADVVERKKGKWIKNDFYEDALMCSCCHAYLDKEDWSRHYFYFCHHCGAFMEGMDVEEEKTDERFNQQTGGT